MGNRYNSREINFFGDPIIGETVSPGTDLTLSSDGTVECIPKIITGSGVSGLFGVALNRASNILIKEAGLFSNFADGLVFKNVYDYFKIRVKYATYNVGTQLTGVLTSTDGSNIINGAGTLFTGELNVGDIILPSNEVQFYTVKNIVNDTQIEVNESVTFGSANESYNKINLAATTFNYSILPPLLNSFTTVDQFYNAGFGVDDDDGVLLSFAVEGSAEFKTNSIDTSYVGSIVYLAPHIVAEVTEA